MDIDMCKSFTAIEMIDRKTENTVASIQGTMYFGKILPHAPPSPLPGIVKRIGVKKRNSERGNLHKFLIRFSLIS